MKYFLEKYFAIKNVAHLLTIVKEVAAASLCNQNHKFCLFSPNYSSLLMHSIKYYEYQTLKK